MRSSERFKSRAVFSLRFPTPGTYFSRLRGSKFGRPSLLRSARALAASRRVDGTVSALRAGAGLRSGRVARSATNLVARVSGFSRLSVKVFLNAGFSLRGASVRGRSFRARSEAGRSARGRSDDGRSDVLRSGRPVVGRAPRSLRGEDERVSDERGAEVRDLPVVGFDERERSNTGTSALPSTGFSARGLETFDSA